MKDTIVGNRSLDRFDVLIIGSGPTGAAIASILCAHGKKVLILEAGANYYQGLDDPSPGKPTSFFSNDEVKFIARGLVVPDAMAMPRTYRKSELDGKRLRVGDINQMPQTVGGGSVHADMKYPRFAPVDFQLGTLLGKIPGASFADWPVSYADLEPFYTYVEYAVGVQGKDGADPFGPPRSKPYPMAPGVAPYSGLLLAEGAKKIGYTAFPAPTAINSRPRDGRPACRECGFCGGFGCPINAKATSAVVTLRKALLSGNCQLWSETRAVKLVRKSGQSTVSGVEALLPDGSRRTFTADRYVLACNAIEDARLLLLSEPGGLGNSSGLVGRNLMFHTLLTAFSFFEERIHPYRGRGSAYFITDFRGVPGDPKRPLGGVIEVGGGILPIDEGVQISQMVGGAGPRLKAMLRQGVAREHSLAMTLFCEDAPQLSNRLDLDLEVRDINGLPVSRITYQPHAFEQTAADYYGPKMLDILMASGAKYAALQPMETPSQSRHLHGTLRFGKDPTQSVCRPDGRLHDIDNLYACGGALFPTSSGYNPTLTMAALAMRIGGEMIFPGSPEKALPPLPMG